MTDSSAIITWSVSPDSADAGAFIIDSDDVLSFAAMPDFENPTDANGDNVYMVTVEAMANGETSTTDVEITVTNDDEMGTVTVTPATAGVGGTFTATLMDEDGHTGVSWDWWYDDMMDGDFADQVPGALSHTYTAEAAYAGMYLKARAVYTDGEFGSDEVGSNVVMVVEDPHHELITKYDTSGNNAIERAEILAVIDRLLANYPGVTRTEVLGLIDLLLQW